MAIDLLELRWPTFTLPMQINLKGATITIAQKQMPKVLPTELTSLNAMRMCAAASCLLLPRVDIDCWGFLQRISTKKFFDAIAKASVAKRIVKLQAIDECLWSSTCIASSTRGEGYYRSGHAREHLLHKDCPLTSRSLDAQADGQPGT